MKRLFTIKSVLACLTLLGLSVFAAACTDSQRIGKERPPTGTPPPSASNLPPPVPPGKTPGPGR